MAGTGGDACHGYRLRMDRDQRDLIAKVAGLMLAFLVSSSLLAWAIFEVLFAEGWRKLFGLGLLAAGLTLWSVTFWLIADRPSTWNEPGRNPRRRRRPGAR